MPYRTQLDGSDYESANCGPTTLGMALEAFGVDIAPPTLRNEVLESEDFNPDDVDAGSFIWALARVAQSRGLRTYGLYESDGETLHHWSVDEVRANVRAGAAGHCAGDVSRRCLGARTLAITAITTW